MNTLWIVVVAAVIIYLAYNFYAKSVDRNVIQADAKKATPAKMYMDGVDFMPTNRNVLFGYHFKSIAAAGPIVGVITAANLWGWLPSLLWLMIGVSFIGWASDYSAIVVAVRNDGNSLSAISHRLIAPRTRNIMFVFIFFYLLLIAGAFMGIMAALLAARPDVPLGVITLGVMGLLAGQMLYRWKMDLIVVTLIVVVVTLAAMLLGPVGLQSVDGKLDFTKGPISSAMLAINGAVDSITGKTPITVVTDPTAADPRIPAPGADGKRASTALYNADTGARGGGRGRRAHHPLGAPQPLGPPPAGPVAVRDRPGRRASRPARDKRPRAAGAGLPRLRRRRALRRRAEAGARPRARPHRRARARRACRDRAAPAGRPPRRWSARSGQRGR